MDVSLMPDALQPFEANGFPLEPGLQLLEASAGTGKTFALAHLVLRLVAEQGLSLRQVLVVTYTEAAAAELRDRIGERLAAALAVLEALAHPQDPAEPLAPDQPCNQALDQAPDAVLRHWLEVHAPSDRGSGRLRGRLLLALEELDGADITTIHGFCRRSLQRLALEAATPPDQQLETDASELIQQVVHAYWQQQVLSLSPGWLAGLLARKVTPELLGQVVTQLDGDPALQLDPLPEAFSATVPLAELLPPTWKLRWRQFRQQWQERGRELEAAFCSAAAAWKQAGATSISPYAGKPRTDRCGALDRWLAELDQAGADPPDLDTVLQQPLLQTYFHPAPFVRLARRWEGIPEPSLPQAPLLQAIAALVEGPAELVLLHGAHHCRQELARRRRRRGSFGFSQLLEGLDPGAAATAPTPLLEAVGRRYRVALVDEFQDTDPIQWRILRLAFGQGEHQLVMVGDPKQAIYRFRGGDLDTYRLASQQASARYGLLQNFRSSPTLLAAFQGLMAPGLRRSALVVPALTAQAQARSPQDPPIQLLWCPPARSRGALEQLLPAGVAQHCRALLGQGLRLAKGEAERPLRRGDLCVLVSTHRQAEQMRQALAQQGLPSRLVSRADVFASPAATALQRLLDALADPADGNRLRLLAASPLLGWEGTSLADSSNERWSALSGQLAALAQLVPRQGLLGVIPELLGSTSLARLSQDGRLLADLQQLAALVQERLHRDQLPLEAAGAWLRRLRLDPDRWIPEEHQVHSDQADDAIAVVTVHRSKGLEYPVVLCPYLWQAPAGPAPGAADTGLRWQPPGSEAPHLDLRRQRHWGRGWQAAQQHRQAELAERERLAYVAVTRAAQLLVLAWGPVKGQQQAPLVPWLFPELALECEEDPFAEGDPAPWRQRLEARIASGELAIELLPWPDPEAEMAPVRAGAAAEPGMEVTPDPQALACGPLPRQPLDRRWGRSSYTSWTRTAVSPLALEEGRDTADPELPEQALSPPAATGASAAEPLAAAASPGPWAPQGPLASFPRGAAAGDCLHQILETLDLQIASTAPANRELVARQLERAGLMVPIEPVLEGLEQMRLTPFGGDLGALRVADLPAGQRLHEMHFDLSLGWARAGALAEAFAAHPGGPFAGAYAASLARLPVDSTGFLTGSIDLVFTAPAANGDERWWVVDWKSNWLGERDSQGQPLACGPLHYSPAAMTALMAHSHYPLQAHLYLVALHRYLRWRLPGYTIERHLGGYAYVFLRGTPGSAGAAALPGAVPGMVVEQPPPGRILALDAALGQPS